MALFSQSKSLRRWKVARFSLFCEDVADWILPRVIEDEGQGVLGVRYSDVGLRYVSLDVAVRCFAIKFYPHLGHRRSSFTERRALGSSPPQ